MDDGSTDGTTAKLDAIQRDDPAHVRVVFLQRNSGQTAALLGRPRPARGEILVPIDGDRQNDPADIPRLLRSSKRATTWFQAGASSGTMPSSRERCPPGSPTA